MAFMGLGYFILFITLMIVWTLKVRKANNNVMSYGNAFLHMLIMWAVAATIGGMFNLLYGNVINPDYPYEIADMTIVQTEEWLVNAGMSDDEIESQLMQIEEDTLNSFTVGGMLMSLVGQYIMAAIISALISLFVWKRAPKEPTPSVSADES